MGQNAERSFQVIIFTAVHMDTRAMWNIRDANNTSPFRGSPKHLPFVVNKVCAVESSFQRISVDVSE